MKQYVGKRGISIYENFLLLCFEILVISRVFVIVYISFIYMLLVILVKSLSDSKEISSVRIDKWYVPTRTPVILIMYFICIFKNMCISFYI